MTYNPSIPKTSDRPSASQSQILANFSQANIIFGVDHVQFDNATVANRGKHNMVSFIQQVAGPGSVAAEIVLYQKDVTGSSELFFERDGSGNEIQMTGLPITSNSTVTNGTGTNYGITTPWGIIINWGLIQLTSDPTTITLAVPFNNTNYSVTTTRDDSSVLGSTKLVNIDAKGTTTFACRASSYNVSINYIAIGN